MDLLLEELYSRLDLWLMIFARITGFFTLSPVLGRRNLPVHIKAGFSLIFSFIVFFTLSPVGDVVINSFIQLAFYVFKEFIAGLVMGYVTTLIFSAILIAGQIIDTQIGFGIVHVIDPQNYIQVPLIGNLLYILALLMFFTINGHHTLLKLLCKSFEILPPGMVQLAPDMTMEILYFFRDTFLLAVKIAFPLITVTLLVEAALGIIARTVPQMNVFIVGIPLKILVGLVILFLFIPAYIAILDESFDTMFDFLKAIVRGMGLGWR